MVTNFLYWTKTCDLEKKGNGERNRETEKERSGEIEKSRDKVCMKINRFKKKIEIFGAKMRKGNLGQKLSQQISARKERWSFTIQAKEETTWSSYRMDGWLVFSCLLWLCGWLAGLWVNCEWTVGSLIGWLIGWLDVLSVNYLIGYMFTLFS